MLDLLPLVRVGLCPTRCDICDCDAGELFIDCSTPSAMSAFWSRIQRVVTTESSCHRSLTRCTKTASRSSIVEIIKNTVQLRCLWFISRLSKRLNLRLPLFGCMPRPSGKFPRESTDSGNVPPPSGTPTSTLPLARPAEVLIRSAMPACRRILPMSSLSAASAPILSSSPRSLCSSRTFQACRNASLAMLFWPRLS